MKRIQKEEEESWMDESIDESGDGGNGSSSNSSSKYHNGSDWK